MRDLIVLMPVYNDQKDMIRTLDSINEDNNDFSVLIIDDGSKTPLTLNNRQYKFTVKIHRLTVNKGITGALNAGLDLISEMDNIRYIARLDAGDIQVKNRFKTQRLYFNKNQKTKLLGSNVSFYDVNGAAVFDTNLPLTDAAIKKEKFIRSCFIHPTVMFSKEIIEEGLRYSENYPCAEDYELFLRITNKYEVANLSDKLLFCHDRANGISITRRKKQISSVLKCLLTHRDYKSPYWYVGIGKVLAQYFVPRSVFSYIKARLS
ncbi:TPA: glycosyltransferase [Enterobacter hormaechei]